MDKRDEKSLREFDENKASGHSNLQMPLRYRAIRKFPLNSSLLLHKKKVINIKVDGAEGSVKNEDDVFINVNGRFNDDIDGEEEDDDNDTSVKSDERNAKKFRLAEDSKTLKNIFITEDFINFLCYKSYKEVENADEQRKIIAESFKEENLDKSCDNLQLGVIVEQIFPPKDESEIQHPPTLQIRNGIIQRNYLNTSEKSIRTSNISPVSKESLNKEELKDALSLKNRLRPSTKALTAATDKEHLMKVKRRTPQHLQLNEFSDSFESHFCYEQSLNDRQDLFLKVGDNDEKSDKLKTILPTYALNEDFSKLYNYIGQFINSQNQLAFLIQPPSSFKIECNISQHLRISTHNQYIHRFYNRWGKNSIQLACIMYFLDSHGIAFTSHPLIGGVEMDLVGLSEGICKYGGLQKVIDDVLWPEVVKSIKVPKMSRDKISRFYEVYCRYLLSYDSLSVKEKQKLERKVFSCNNSACCDDLCVSKGRCRTLNELYDVACSIASMFDLDDASSQQVLSKYWNIVQVASPHVTVHTAFIKPSDISRRQTLIKNMMTLASSLRCCSNSLCPLNCDEDVLDSRLEIEMMFSTRCWTRDRLGRGVVSYNHTGADIIWYFVSGQDELKFKSCLKEIVPNLVDHESQFWLPANTVMVPPDMLIQHGVSVSQITHQAGQLVVIPPDTFFSSVSFGYNISEHVYFLPHNWLLKSSKAFSNLRKSCVETIFSLERFVFLMSSVGCFHPSISQVLDLMEGFVSRELKLRKALMDVGVRKILDRVGGEDGWGSDGWVSRIIKHEMKVCHHSKDFCFFSIVKEIRSDVVYCLECAVKRLLKKKNSNYYELIIYFTQSELSEVVSKAKKCCK